MRKPSLPVLAPADHRPAVRGREAPAHSRRAAEGGGPLPTLEEGSVRQEARAPRGIRSEVGWARTAVLPREPAEEAVAVTQRLGLEGQGQPRSAPSREAVGARAQAASGARPTRHARTHSCPPRTLVALCAHPCPPAHTHTRAHTPVSPPHTLPTPQAYARPCTPCPSPHTRDHAHTACCAGLCPPRTPLTLRTHCPPRTPVPHPTHLYPHTALRPTG